MATLPQHFHKKDWIGSIVRTTGLRPPVFHTKAVRPILRTNCSSR